jgi:uncharacterized protein YdhG (YjbR/CyaY superfamily)
VIEDLGILAIGAQTVEHERLRTGCKFSRSPGDENGVMDDAVRASFEVTGPCAAPGIENGVMEDAVRDYIDAIAPEHRPLFDRLHRLVLEAHPDAAVVLSYEIPTYKVGRRRLFIGVWKHGVSLYGWQQGRDAGFTDRHAKLKTGRGTIQLRPEDAAGIPDGELRDLARAALDA